MTQVYQSTIIQAPAGIVWSTVRDFNALPKWHSLITDSHIENGLPSDQVGCIRNFTLQDGNQIRERLLALSDFDLSFSYSIHESPMALTDYVATLSLRPVTENDTTFIDWTAEFDCQKGDEAELVRLIGQDVFIGGFNSLKHTLGV